jgi:hypothetical protein
MPLIRFCRVVAAAIVAVGALIAVSAGAVAAAPAAQEDAQQGATQEDAAQRLAEKYAPIVFLREQAAECDKDGQVYEPRPVEMIFDQPQITLHDGSGQTVAEGVDAAELFEQGSDYYINLPGSPKDAGCTYETDYRRLREGQPAVAYAHIARQDDHGGFALQYWFYYYFNDWNNKHESDWEMVQLIFDVDTVEEALETAPVATGYSQHSGGESADWDDDKVQKDGDHPHVYVAVGAQSNFYDDATFLGRAEQGAGFGCDDASGPSRSVQVEPRVVPQEISGPGDPFAWATYEGRWGERLSGEFNGPTGPNTKRAWREPFGWQEDLRETSVVVPISRTYSPGFNVSELFCGIVAWGSQNLLVTFMSSPWVVIGGALAILGGAAIMFIRTRYRPVRPEPLRQRRYLGQMMSTATRIYATHPFVMLAIGLAFIPAGIVASIIQLALASLPGTGPIYDIFMRSTLSQLAVVIGIGAFFVIVAFGVVMAGVARTMDRIDRGEQPSIVDAYRAIGEHLPALFFSRLRAAVIITLIGLTIVGLPWAVQRFVRWLFVEWTVMIEGKRGREALEASADTVDGHWWWTFGASFVLITIGIGLAPLIGLALLLFSDLPLATINGIASVLYLALVPWTAIGLSLLYYDLKARAMGEMAPEPARAPAGPRPQPATGS